MEAIKFPTKELSSINELVQYRQKEATNNKNGIKRTNVENTETERLEIKEVLDDLKQSLSNKRIERLSVRSKAEWNSSTKTIKLIRKEGKFQSFGYSKNGHLYLENYETLLLIELNRLELYFDTILVSLEQAYILLLGEESSKHFDKYFVYSTLCRSGYIVRSYNQNYKYQTQNVDTPSSTDCVWEILQESLDSQYKVPSTIKSQEIYYSIKESFNFIKEGIKNTAVELSTCESSGIDFNRKIITKRKNPSKSDDDDNLESWIKNKKLKLSENEKTASFLDILKNEPEYQKFENIFEKFNTFQLPTTTTTDNDNDEHANDVRQLEIDFDLYLPKENFKKSNPKPPNLRAIVIQSDEDFPTYREITKCYEGQWIKVPLVVISISESKHMQGFLYYFN